MKQRVKLTESNLRRIVKESVNKILKEDYNFGVENIPVYEVINEHISLTEINDILNSRLYNSNDEFVGKLSELHFKYDPENNSMC